MDPVREMWHVCTFGTHTKIHREANEPQAFRRNGLRLSRVWKMLWLQCRVCESSMSHLIPNAAVMPKCLSGDVHTWSQDSRGRTLCSHCNSSSLRLKESVKHTKAASDHFHLVLHVVHHTSLKVCELKISHSASIIYRIFMYYTFLIQHSLKDILELDNFFFLAFNQSCQVGNNRRKGVLEKEM